MGGKNICDSKKFLKGCGKCYVYSMGWKMFFFFFNKFLGSLKKFEKKIGGKIICHSKNS